MDVGATGQDERYRQAAAAFGPALERLARAYEADTELRRDLLQEIHTALWRSFAGFAQDCSVRTWVYRVAHNVGASHVLRSRRANSAALASLDELALQADDDNPEHTVATRHQVRATVFRTAAPRLRRCPLLPALQDLRRGAGLAGRASDGASGAGEDCLRRAAAHAADRELRRHGFRGAKAERLSLMAARSVLQIQGTCSQQPRYCKWPHGAEHAQ